jgi:hypothetical protein
MPKSLDWVLWLRAEYVCKLFLSESPISNNVIFKDLEIMVTMTTYIKTILEKNWAALCHQNAIEYIQHHTSYLSKNCLSKIGAHTW